MLPFFGTAQLISFQDKPSFDADISSNCTSCAMAYEGFAQFTDGETISDLSFPNIQVQVSGGATAHYGNWNYFPGCSNTFVMGALQVTDQEPVTLTFSEPIYGFGGFFYDYGFPYSEISISATSMSNQTMTISESCPEMGDTGFMGFCAAEGLQSITISTNVGTIDMDNIALAQLPMTTPATVEVMVGNVASPSGTQVCVPVSATNFVDVKGFQHSLTYDSGILDYQSFNAMSLPSELMVSEVSDGVLAVSWSDDQMNTPGITLPSDTPIFELCFNVVGFNGSRATLQCSGSPLAVEFFNSNMAMLPNTMANGSVFVGTQVAIPTMGEWGLFLFFLLVATLGVTYIYQLSLRTVTSTGISSTPMIQPLPFDSRIFLVALKHAAILAVLGFGVILLFWGEIVVLDLMMMPIAMLVMAYLIHIILLFGQPHQE